jgi:phosphate transport system protein
MSESPPMNGTPDYDDELAQLGAEIARLGGLVEAQIVASVDSMTRRDVAQASNVVAADERIDRLQADIEQMTLRLIALRQPAAADLRHAMSAMKISMQLERCGDLAKNIAKRGLVLAKGEPVTPFNRSIDRMGRLVTERLKTVLDAYAVRDVERAVQVWSRDEEVDEHYNAIFRELLTYMMGDPRTITPCTHLLFVAKNLERIGDHATNIAEIAHYEITGEPLSGDRPKFDTLQHL